MVGGAATSCNSYSILLSNDPKPADNTGFGPVMISSQESLAPGVYNIHIASKFKKKAVNSAADSFRQDIRYHPDTMSAIVEKYGGDSPEAM